MSNAMRVLSQLAYLDIFKSSLESQSDLKAWLANQRYFVEPGLTQDGFRLIVKDSDYLIAALGNDCNRMAMAAVESVSGIKKDPDLPKSSSWGTIRAYYAAFFAAHAMLRMFGQSCSQLNTEHVNKVFELAKLQNINGAVKSIDSGFYEIKINKTFTQIDFQKVKDSHKDTWGCFLKLIDFLESELPSTTAISKHKDEARDLLIQLKNGISKSGSRNKGNWLSEIRNQINYQHLFGTWFPYERRSQNSTLVENASTYWHESPHLIEPGSKTKELEIFFELTALILAIFREMMFTCHDRVSPMSKTFRNGTFKLLSTLKIGNLRLREDA